MFTATPYILEKAYTCDDREELVRQLRRLNAEQIMLFTEFDHIDEKCRMLRELIDFFAARQIKTVLWVRTITTPHVNAPGMKDERGGESILKCPLNREFQAFYREHIRKFAESGVKTIMLEDDFRMHMPHEAANCFCDDHMALYRDLLGEDLPREELAEKMLRSGSGKYRDAWLEGCRRTLLGLARLIREELDAVDPEIEVIFDCGPALFGADGTDPFELIDILRGRGQPTMRLIGAPYWQELVGRNHLMSVIDFTRHQAHECRKRGVVTLGEVDPYPRPRYTCPAVYAEFFHTAMIADGNFDAAFKYGLDYVSSVRYETGYVEETERNKPLYADIERIFAGKKAVGVKLFEPFDAVRYADQVPPVPERHVIDTPSRDILSGNSIPVAFEGEGPSLVFGDNAWCYQAEDMKNGTILDMVAAEILTRRGFDVGLVRAESHAHSTAPVDMFDYEHFYEENEDLLAKNGITVYDVELKAGARVLSEFSYGGEKSVSSYVYENAEGARFLVYGFDARNVQKQAGILCAYCRQRQLVKYHEWLCGKKLDAVCLGNPFLYSIVKKGEGSLAIGLWNFYPDRVMNPVIDLAEAYEEAEFIGCSGRLEGNQVILDEPPHAFGCCFIHLRK